MFSFLFFFKEKSKAEWRIKQPESNERLERRTAAQITEHLSASLKFVSTFSLLERKNFASARARLDRNWTWTTDLDHFKIRRLNTNNEAAENAHKKKWRWKSSSKTAIKNPPKPKTNKNKAARCHCKVLRSFRVQGRGAGRRSSAGSLLCCN